MKAIILFLILILSLNSPSYAQDDLLEMLEKSDTISTPEIVTATFKGTRIVHGHSVEIREPRVLDFLIMHRFGRVNSGAYEFFGLDEANVRIGLDYGIARKLNIGIGRNSFEKTFDGFVKYKLAEQKEGPGSLPFSAVIFASTAINTLRFANDNLPSTSRLFYTWQVLVARKFNRNFSLQLSPTLVHRNMVRDASISNEIYAIGIGGRHKLSQRVAITAEYFYQANKPEQINTYNSLSLGVSIETGGHVFQLHLSNSRAMNEKGFITETTGNVLDGDIHFGFNISRVFDL